MKRSVNFAGMGGKHGRYARSVQGFVDACRAVGMSDDEIRVELLKMQAEKAKVQAAKAALDAVFGPPSPEADAAFEQAVNNDLNPIVEIDPETNTELRQLTQDVEP